MFVVIVDVTVVEHVLEYVITAAHNSIIAITAPVPVPASAAANAWAIFAID